MTQRPVTTSVPSAVRTPLRFFSLEKSKHPKQPVLQCAIAEKVTLNVSGLKFETYESTLARFPNTLLGSRSKRTRYYNSETDEYYFSRDKTAFDCILFFYQSNGKLITPVEEFVPSEVFRREVAFFELGKKAELQLSVADFEDEVDIIGHGKYGGSLSTVRRIWFILDSPDSSTHGKMLGLWCVFIISLFITAKCLETMPMFQQMNATAKCNVNFSSSSSPVAVPTDNFKKIWFFLKLFCSACMSVEYLARILTAPDKLKYPFSALGVIDVLSFAPHFFLLGVDDHLSPDWNPLRNLLKFLPFLSILKTSRYSTGLQIFWKSIRSSRNELGLLLYCLFLSVVFFGSIIYYCEDGRNGYTSIPASLWYAIVTMTTVGYGDLVPSTLVGKLFSACFAVIGVSSLLALPTTVVVNNFNSYYNSRRKQKLKRFKEEKDWDIGPEL